DTSIFDSLVAEYPTTTLAAAGRKVGLKAKEPGNSEAGHLNLGLGRKIAVPPRHYSSGLSQVLAAAGCKQLKLAETEKFAHVTYYFNGGRDQPFPDEEWVLIPSPQVSSYANKPAMSALEITKRLIAAIEAGQHDFILVNFANADMLGHTGDFLATTQAISILDKCLGKIVKAVNNTTGVLLVSADHGNAESMLNMQTDEANNGHTDNSVPFVVVGPRFSGRSLGWPDLAGGDISAVLPTGTLADVAPTILQLMGIAPPQDMTGRSLINISVSFKN
ncbi:MAG: alkaline phosphatase family protein, partial [Elusimicrobiales bacterium]|nr:alkaline phosphatase family protein [Elusimicrobiales bacterium]